MKSSTPRTAMRQKLRVLVVEDCDEDFLIVQFQLGATRLTPANHTRSFSLLRVSSLPEAVNVLRDEEIDVILLSLTLSGVLPLGAVSRVRAIRPELPIVALDEQSNEELALEVLQHGAQDYLVKGMSDEYLGYALAYAVERQKNLLELNRAKETALSATKAKSEFLANITHEIRTPLTAIIGFSETMLEAEGDPAQVRPAAEAVVRNSYHLLQLIDHVLDMSKIEAGRLEVEHERCEVLKLVEEVLQSVALRAEYAGLEFSFEPQLPLPRWIRTDTVRLRQILYNITGNALKFTRSGSIRLGLHCDRKLEQMVIRVTDTGIGISREQQNSIFSPFVQADTSITREFGGTGLGLSLSRRLARMLGGDITCESSPGRGSTFTITIATGPLASSSFIREYSPERRISSPPEREHNSEPIPARILVVDDAEDNRLLLSHLLGRVGANVVQATNGAEAVRYSAKQDFDLILMDMQMPILDGFRATRKLRETGVTIPIVALTASTLKERVSRCLQAGCTAYLAKPFAKDELYSLIRRLLEEGQHQRRPTSPNIGATRSGLDEAIHAFLTSLPERRTMLLQAAQAENRNELKLAAHRLTSAELFGFPRITRLARALEEALEVGDEMRMKQLTESLQRTLHATIEEQNLKKRSVGTALERSTAYEQYTSGN